MDGGMPKRCLNKPAKLYKSSRRVFRAISQFSYSTTPADCGHARKAKDALVANRMNLGPGGKQPTMRDTIWGGGCRQRMVYEFGDREWEEYGATGGFIALGLVGKPKGIKRILQERGLWRNDLKKQCGKKKKAGNLIVGQTLRSASLLKLWNSTRHE